MERLLKDTNRTRIDFAHVVVFSTITRLAIVEHVTFRSMGILYGNSKWDITSMIISNLINYIP